MKKFLIRIIVALVLVCCTAFMFSACLEEVDDYSSPSSSEQSSEDSSGNGDSSGNEDSSDSGIWTPPAKQ